MMMSTSRFSGFLLLAGLCLASSPSFGATLQENLAKYAATLTRTVSQGRELHVYHWAPRSSVVAGKDTRRPLVDLANEYLGYLKEVAFWQARGSGAAGGGIYAAADPVATASYGGGANDWVLIQFVLEPGVKFLDALSDPMFPAELAAQARQAGCGSVNLIGLLTNPYSPGCKYLRDELIRVSGAGAIRYNYSVANLRSCPSRRQGAFVLFGDDAINWGRISVFTPDVPAGEEPGRLENRLIIRDVFLDSGFYSPIWPSLNGRNASSDVHAWMRANLMGCGSFPEDR
jgi:hypothetical protein